MINTRKAEGQRMRDKIVGMPFPPDRAEELKQVAASQYVTVACFCRALVLQELDRLKKEKGKNKAV